MTTQWWREADENEWMESISYIEGFAVKKANFWIALKFEEAEFVVDLIKIV